MFKFLMIASSILGLSFTQGAWTEDEIDEYMASTSIDPDFELERDDSLSCVEMECICLEPRNDHRWWTASGTEFLLPENLKNHFHADLIIYERRICKYRIQWFHGEWSQWYYPGINDNIDTDQIDDVWNHAAYLAGRKQWSLFDNHFHYVCYCLCGKNNYC